LGTHRYRAMKLVCRSLIWVAAYVPMGRLTSVLLGVAIKGYAPR
jgi:hypothetical protein